jgi:hypothetical protein
MFPEAPLLLLTETDPPREVSTTDGVEIIPVWKWLLSH